MSNDQNPFAKTDPDRSALWEMLVARDIEAFIARDWSKVSGDFTSGHFFGVHGHFQANPDKWRLVFPSVESYRDEWLRQAEQTAKVKYSESLRAALFDATSLLDIDICEDKAVLHKKFDGAIKRQDGGVDRLNWQTLYFCAKSQNRWVITGFVGYIPFSPDSMS